MRVAQTYNIGWSAAISMHPLSAPTNVVCAFVKAGCFATDITHASPTVGRARLDFFLLLRASGAVFAFPECAREHAVLHARRRDEARPIIEHAC